jgi:very-short-patch-repair endonuclease
MTEPAILKARANAMRKAPTLAEDKLWQLVRNRGCGGLKFRRQVPIGDYIADFACFAPRLTLEADGSSHYGSDYDAERDSFFIYHQRFKVLRFRNEMILAEPHLVIEAILRAAGMG